MCLRLMLRQTMMRQSDANRVKVEGAPSAGELSRRLERGNGAVQAGGTGHRSVFAQVLERL